MVAFILNTLGLWITIPLGILLYFFSKQIHKNEKVFHISAFILAFVLSIIAVLNAITSFRFQVPILKPLIVDGNLSFSLFLLVMLAGAFRNKSKPRTSFMLIRREMAAIGLVLLIPHAVSRISIALSGYNSTGLIAMTMMIPLVIVSIPKVRRKIGQALWKKLHRAAYVVYFLIYIHLAFLIYFINGELVIQQRSYAWIFHLTYIVYLILRITKDWKYRLKLPF